MSFRDHGLSSWLGHDILIRMTQELIAQPDMYDHVMRCIQTPEGSIDLITCDFTCLT